MFPALTYMLKYKSDPLDFFNTRFYLIFLTNEIKFQILLFMCENAPDHLVGRVRQVGFFSFGAGWVQVSEFFGIGCFEILRKY